MAYPDALERMLERRKEIEYEKKNHPAMHHIIGEDHWLYFYKSGKIVKSYKDKRKKDEVISDAKF